MLKSKQFTLRCILAISYAAETVINHSYMADWECWKETGKVQKWGKRKKKKRKEKAPSTFVFPMRK